LTVNVNPTGQAGYNWDDLFPKKDVKPVVIDQPQLTHKNGDS
jgi:hypothetical protein